MRTWGHCILCCDPTPHCRATSLVCLPLQGGIESLPSGIKVDAILLPDARLAGGCLGRLPELLTPHGIAVICSSSGGNGGGAGSGGASGCASSSSGGSVDMQVRLWISKEWHACLHTIITCNRYIHPCAEAAGCAWTVELLWGAPLCTGMMQLCFIRRWNCRSLAHGMPGQRPILFDRVVMAVTSQMPRAP